jgi:NTE family protein
MSAPTLREWLASEPFTLVMSSGFFGFYAHAGVLRALHEAGLQPARAAGSSAGALVTGAYSAGVTPSALCERLTQLERREFWDPGLGPGWLRGRLFGELLEGWLPVRTFAECRIPLQVSVFDIGARATHVLDDGPLAPALRASCAVPLLFHPVRHAQRWLYDGGILDRPGLAGVAPGQRVFYHHLSSRWLGYGVPRRAGMVALEIAQLPQSDVFRLHRGRQAMDLATRATERALELPLCELVRVHGSGSPS